MRKIHYSATNHNFILKHKVRVKNDSSMTPMTSFINLKHTCNGNRVDKTQLIAKILKFFIMGNRV